MHIHYDYTVFDMINCQEYIIAVLVKLLFCLFFLIHRDDNKNKTKRLLWLLSNSEDISLKFLYFGWMEKQQKL